MDIEDFQELYEKYLQDVRRVTSEANKSFFFIQLVQNAFKANIDYLEKVFPQIEKFVDFKGKVVVSRGRIDSLLGNVLIEFESDVKKTKKEAEEQIRKYISILWNTEIKDLGTKVNYLALGSDGEIFYVYRPETSIEGEISPDDISLIPIEEFAIEDKTAREFLVWLDYTFLSREPKIPTTEDFKFAFGVGTRFYKVILNELKKSVRLFKTKNREPFDTIFSEWSNYLSIAYGSSVDNEEFFLKHTYLSMLAKLMIYSFFSKGVVPIKKETIASVLGGEEFRKWGIRNFLEEDFFSWITRETVKEEGIKIARNILDILARYDLTKLNEDVLKGLYENLLDQTERHDLGEVYTPDWLVEAILRHSLSENPKKAILDPACGSGTFLFIGIRRKKELLKLPKIEMLNHILDNVKGIDIHPLAVLTAKTNYILALGGLVRIVPRGEIVLPIYMADSMRLIDEEMTHYHNVNCYRIPTVDDKTYFFLPADFIQAELLQSEEIDSLIDLTEELSLDFLKTESINKSRLKDYFHSKLTTQKKEKDYVEVMAVNVRTLAKIIENNRDTIWTFIIKNKYKPIDFANRKFDLVTGNPPWIVYNSVKNVDYQNFLKRLIKDNYSLTLSSTLMTNMEMATLFYTRCNELYLKERAETAFVMPRSVFSADQHSNFRNGNFKRVRFGFHEIWDLDNVKPLFRVPSCVVFAKKGKKTRFPIRAKIFRGNLSTKNENYEIAFPKISIEDCRLFLSRIGKRDFLSYEKIEFEKESYYYKKFFRGAEILPQAFWLVEIQETELGYDAQKPYVKTQSLVLRTAKKPWNDFTFEGNVESKFLYEVVTCSYLFPFSYRTSFAVLPILPTRSGFSLVRADLARGSYPLLAKWLEKAERLWTERRKQKKKFDIYQWINYNKKLSRQNPKKKYKVVYNETGKDVVANVIDMRKRKNRVILAKATIYYETDDKDEAYFLTSLLNSPKVNRLIKPMQAKGLWGERGIEKKLLEIPFPRFNRKNTNHRRLAQLGLQSSKKAQAKLDRILLEFKGEIKPQHVGRIRAQLRDFLQEELKEIDKLTEIVMRQEMKSNQGMDKFLAGSEVKKRLGS